MDVFHMPNNAMMRVLRTLLLTARLLSPPLPPPFGGLCRSLEPLGVVFRDLRYGLANSHLYCQHPTLEWWSSVPEQPAIASVQHWCDLPRGLCRSLERLDRLQR